MRPPEAKQREGALPPGNNHTEGGRLLGCLLALLLATIVTGGAVALALSATPETPGALQ